MHGSLPSLVAVTVKRTSRASTGLKHSTLRRAFTAGRRAGQRLLLVEPPLDAGDALQELQQRRVALVGGAGGAVGVIDTREGGLQRVEVLLRDRVELVVVAAGAAHRQAQERRPDDRDH